MSYVLYKTNENDRFDLISSKFYGTPFEYERVIQANPEVQITETLKAGLTIKVPKIEENKNTGNLPIWKQ